MNYSMMKLICWCYRHDGWKFQSATTAAGRNEFKFINLFKQKQDNRTTLYACIFMFYSNRKDWECKRRLCSHSYNKDNNRATNIHINRNNIDREFKKWACVDCKYLYLNQNETSQEWKQTNIQCEKYWIESVTQAKTEIMIKIFRASQNAI